MGVFILDQGTFGLGQVSLLEYEVEGGGHRPFTQPLGCDLCLVCISWGEERISSRRSLASYFRVHTAEDMAMALAATGFPRRSILTYANWP